MEGADFEKDIHDQAHCAESREDAIANIYSERKMKIRDFDAVEDLCFIWDLSEELEEALERDEL